MKKIIIIISTYLITLIFGFGLGVYFLPIIIAEKSQSIEEIEKRTEAKNLICIYSSLMNNSLQKSIDEFAGKNFSEFKEKLSDVVVKEINPISSKIKELLDDKVFLEKILKEGYEKANEIASKKIKKIHEIVGF